MPAWPRCHCCCCGQRCARRWKAACRCTCCWSFRCCLPPAGRCSAWGPGAMARLARLDRRHVHHPGGSQLDVVLAARPRSLMSPTVAAAKYASWWLAAGRQLAPARSGSTAVSGGQRRLDDCHRRHVVPGHAPATVRELPARRPAPCRHRPGTAGHWPGSDGDSPRDAGPATARRRRPSAAGRQRVTNWLKRTPASGLESAVALHNRRLLLSENAP